MSNIFQIEDNLIFFKSSTTSIFESGSWTQYFRKIEDDLKLWENRRWPYYFDINILKQVAKVYMLLGKDGLASPNLSWAQPQLVHYILSFRISYITTFVNAVFWLDV